MLFRFAIASLLLSASSLCAATDSGWTPPHPWKDTSPPPPGQPPPHQKMYDELNLELNQAEQLEKGAEEEPKRMTGTWGGGRTYLLKHGVDISMSYVTDMLANPSGGAARGFAYAGSFGIGLNVDFGKACGLTGFEFYSSAAWRTGTNLSARKINNQFTVAQVYGSQTVRLNELYLKQSLFKERLVLKAGRLDAGNDFLASPFYAQFVNNGFDGNPSGVFYNFPAFSSFPTATWGAFLAFKPADWLVAQFAVYNANTNSYLNKFHGVNFTFSSTNGVIWITEWTALINQGLNSHGMPGNYKVGFFYQTGNVQVFKNGVVHGDPCFYFLIDQMVYRKKGPGNQGLTPFAVFVFAPDNRNTFPFFFMSGLVYKGLFPGRPQDTTNFGVVYGKYSSDQAAVQRAAKRIGAAGPFGNLPQNFETVLEINHWFQVNDWCTITPDFQYVINPKGYGKIQNAFVLGAQMGFVL